MLPDTFWIVVTEHDISPNGFTRTLPTGPLVHETPCLTEEEAEDRARNLAGRFGWTTIIKVDGTQVKRTRYAGPCQPSTVNQASPMPNPAKPQGWCDWCSTRTESKFSDATAAPYCVTCNRLKN